MSVRVRIIRDDGALAALEPAWHELWARIPDATPFQHPAWLLPWWRHLPKGTLEVVAAEGDGRFLGLLPLCRIAGSGGDSLRPLAFDVSDYAEPLVDPGQRDEVGRAMLGALLDLSAWRHCRFVLRRQIPLPLSLPGRLAVRQEVLEPAPLLRLAGLAAAGLPPSIRRSLAEARRRLSRSGEAATFETAVPGTIGPILERLFELHGRRWQERGETGVLDHPSIRSFHLEAAPRLHEAGLLRLLLMRIGGREAAVFYGMAAKRIAYFYIGGFDPEMRAYSPGSLAIAHAVERAVGDGCTSFDFLRGREPYKYRWGATDHDRVLVELAPILERGISGEADGGDASPVSMPDIPPAWPRASPGSSLPCASSPTAGSCRSTMTASSGHCRRRWPAG